QDRNVARAILAALALKRPELSFFLDERGLTGGAYWISRLAEELARADAVLLLVGTRVGSWQELEYYEALDLSRQPARKGRPRIIPVVIADCAPGLSFLNTIHQIFTSNPLAPESMSAIERALNDGVGSEPVPSWRLFQPYKGLPALTEADAAFFYG